MMEEKENKPTCKDFAEYLKKCAEAYAKHGSQELKEVFRQMFCE